ncbi:unnamed protein product [Urochloa humidicola]
MPWPADGGQVPLTPLQREGPRFSLLKRRCTNHQAADAEQPAPSASTSSRRAHGGGYEGRSGRSSTKPVAPFTSAARDSRSRWPLSSSEQCSQKLQAVAGGPLNPTDDHDGLTTLAGYGCRGRPRRQQRVAPPTRRRQRQPVPPAARRQRRAAHPRWDCTQGELRH